jgi:hypothetical protein
MRWLEQYQLKPFASARWPNMMFRKFWHYRDKVVSIRFATVTPLSPRGGADICWMMDFWRLCAL